MEKLFRQIAKNNGISVSDLKKEMQKAIKLAMESEDPKSQAFWNSFSTKDKEPKIEDVIKRIAKDLS